MHTDADAGVVVRAPGRLHLGFFDPAGTLGRRFGSLGLVIDGFDTTIELRAADVDAVIAGNSDAHAEVERAVMALQRLRDRTGLQQPLRLDIVEVLPAHAGFGSGTQLSLALGRAFAQWHGLELTTATVAQWLGRGVRSGIGIAGFDHGGLLIDGGPGADGSVAPLLARLPLPDAWKIVVVRDAGRRGLSGTDERDAIAGLPPLPRASAADICHQVLMRVLPGAATADFAAFSAGINRIQQLLGEHFAPRQNGSAYSSPATGRLMRWSVAIELARKLGRCAAGLRQLDHLAAKLRRIRRLGLGHLGTPSSVRIGVREKGLTPSPVVHHQPAEGRTRFPPDPHRRRRPHDALQHRELRSPATARRLALLGSVNTMRGLT